MCRITVDFGRKTEIIRTGTAESIDQPPSQAPQHQHPVPASSSRSNLTKTTISKMENNRISVPSGVYMHSASIGLYRPPISPQSRSSSTTSSNSDFVDHYAVLSLDMWS